jgi:hypothetical protein
MTFSYLAFFGAVFLVSAVAGALLGVLCRGRIVITIVLGLILSLVLFAAFEWKFGSPEEWSWQSPITSSVYLFAPFVVLVATPTVLAALIVGCCVMPPKVI